MYDLLVIKYIFLIGFKKNLFDLWIIRIVGYVFYLEVDEVALKCKSN